MKVLVLFSGETRCVSQAKLDNISAMFNGYDIKYTTWDDDPMANAPWMHATYPQPKVGYNCEKHIIEECLTSLREFGGTYPSKISEFEEKRGALHFLLTGGRVRGRNRFKQVLAHIAAYNEFALGQDYDMVIRVRYDLIADESKYNAIHIDPMSTETMSFHDLVTKCYNEHAHCGLGYYFDVPNWIRIATQVDYNPEIHPPADKVALIKIDYSDHKSYAWGLGDLIIIHPNNYLRVDFVNERIAAKTQSGGEGGWGPLLAQPTGNQYHYSVFNSIDLHHEPEYIEQLINVHNNNYTKFCTKHGIVDDR